MRLWAFQHQTKKKFTCWAESLSLQMNMLSVPGSAWLTRGSGRALSRGGFVVVWALPVCGEDSQGGLLRLLSLLRYHLLTTPERKTEETPGTTRFLTSKINSKNHDVPEKLENGGHSCPSHLYLCLSCYCSPWDPTGRLVTAFPLNKDRIWNNKEKKKHTHTNNSSTWKCKITTLDRGNSKLQLASCFSTVSAWFVVFPYTTADLL